MLRSDHVSSGRLLQGKNKKNFQIISPQSLHGRSVTFQLSVGREGGFIKLEKWPLIRGNPTGLTESFYDGDSDSSN